MLDTLLLIEPDRRLAEWLDSSLRQAGYAIRTVTDCRAAIAELREGDLVPDVIVLDIDELDSKDLLAYLASDPRLADIDVVFDRHPVVPVNGARRHAA